MRYQMNRLSLIPTTRRLGTSPYLIMTAQGTSPLYKPNSCQAGQELRNATCLSSTERDVVVLAISPLIRRTLSASMLPLKSDRLRHIINRPVSRDGFCCIWASNSYPQRHRLRRCERRRLWYTFSKVELIINNLYTWDLLPKRTRRN